MEGKCRIEITRQGEGHTSHSCCGIIFKKCSVGLEKKLQEPLELSFPKIFGDFDHQQRLLIIANAKPLILVENASEIVNQMKNVYGFIEQIIQYVLEDNKSDYVSLGSHTFPIIVKEKWLDKYPNSDKDSIYGENNGLTEKYDNIIRFIRPIRSEAIPKKAILHMAADMGEAGGHYGIAIKNGKKVIVFDSMQYKGSSSYSAIFSQIAEDVFGIEPVILKSPISRVFCPQPTGGFVYRRKDESLEKFLPRLQDLDSQNHFCYMWAIWYFHIFLLKGEEGIKTIFTAMRKNCIPPLVVIKRYIWAILHYFYPNDKSLGNLIHEVVWNTYNKKINRNQTDFILKFFLLNFRYVWDEIKAGKAEKSQFFQLFSVMNCDLKEVRGAKNINECLKFSLKKVPYVLDNFA